MTGYRDATGTLESAVFSDALSARVGVCGRKAVGEIGFGECVRFVRGAGTEFDARYESIVIVDVGGDEVSEGVDGIEMVNEEPLGV